MVDDLLYHRGIIPQGVAPHIGAVFPHHVIEQLALVLHGHILNLEGVTGGNLIDIIRVDLAALDGLAEQGVHNDHLVFDLIGGTGEPAAVGKAAHLMAGGHGGVGVPAGDRVQNPAFHLIAGLQHGDGDFLLEGRFIEVAHIGMKVEGQELLLFHKLEFLGGEKHTHHGIDGRGKAVVLHNADPVVIVLHCGGTLGADHAQGPFLLFLTARPRGPRANEKNGVFLIRHMEHGKMQLKGFLGKNEGVFRHTLQQKVAESLPVELGVQRLAQAIIEVLQPLKGWRNPHGVDVVGRHNPFQHLQSIQLHLQRLLSPHGRIHMVIMPFSSAFLGITIIASMTHIAKGMPVQQKAV